MASLIGKRFGKLVVVEQAETKLHEKKWLCQCDCGGTHIATTGNLNHGHTTSCGCKKSPDLTGKVFGRLTVLGRSDKQNSRRKRPTIMWECLCECGNITYKETYSLNASKECMCPVCKGKIIAENARKSAGYVDGTQISKIKNMNLTAANTSGARGVSYDRKANKYRARLKFKGKTLYLGRYSNFEDAVKARQAAEREYFGAFLGEIAQLKKDADKK